MYLCFFILGVYQHALGNYLTIQADVQRLLSNLVEVAPDIICRIRKSQSLQLDTERKLNQPLDGELPLTFTLDTVSQFVVPVTVTFDAEREVHNTDLTWRYVNQGTASLLSISGATLTPLDETKSRTGSAFYQTSKQKCFDIPATNEVWIKFDVYFDGSNRWRAFNADNSDSTKNSGITAQTNNSLSFFSDGVNVSPNGANIAGVCKEKELQTFLLHMVSGTSDGVIEAWADGQEIYTYRGDVNHGEKFSDIYLQSDGAGTFFSNVIISNAKISFEDGFQSISADIDLQILQQVQTDFDIEIMQGVGVSFETDIISDVRNAYKISCDVITAIAFSVELSVDVEKKYLRKIILYPIDPEEVFAQPPLLQAKNLRTLSEENSSPETVTVNNIIPTAENNTDGIQSITVTLGEQQITAAIEFTCLQYLGIMAPVLGRYLDYICQMRVESAQGMRVEGISKEGVLYTHRCCSDIDEHLYTVLNYNLPSIKISPWTTTSSSSSKKEIYICPRASQHVANVAAALGLQTVMQFKDFYSTVSIGESEENGATYNDIIRDIFGWSSRVPTQLINVFIRAGTLYVIQRGYEARTIDISNTKHNIPIFSHEITRTFYKRGKWTTTETSEVRTGRPTYGNSSGNSSSGDSSDADSDTDTDTDSGSDENSWTAVGSVTVTDSSGTTTTTYNYSWDGVLMSTTAVFVSSVDPEESSTTKTTNSYNSDKTLSSTTTETTHPNAPENDTKTVTTYGYLTLADDRKFLASEMISTYQRNEVGLYELEGTRVTTKNPTGRGQGAASDNKGNVDASGNTGDDRVTPYSESFSQNDKSDVEKQSRQIDGLALFDVSFPIQNINEDSLDFLSWEEQGVDPESMEGLIDSSLGSERLVEITEAIKWLNRKTKETVNITIYDFPHLIDFNDKIFLYGADYFLVNNTARGTERIRNEQTLTLVRWF